MEKRNPEVYLHVKQNKRFNCCSNKSDRLQSVLYLDFFVVQ